MVLTSLFKKVARGLRSPRAALKHKYQTSRLKEKLDRWRELSPFRRDRDERNRKYRAHRFDNQADDAVIKRLNAEGYVILRQVIDKELLLEIRRELENHLDAATCLAPVSKDSARTPGDLNLSTVHLSKEELARGQGYIGQHANYAQVLDPLVDCRAVVKAAFDELLIDIAAKYLGCLPGVGGLNLRKSYVNELGDFDTLYFHTDPNSPKFLKFFFYLNDVDEDGGPFCFVRGSHVKKFRGWRDKYRWTYDEIAAEYGAESILNLTANLGDLVVADTTGFHRGTKVRSKPRGMLTVDYVVHVEFQGKQEPFKIPRKDYETLTEKQRIAADFLEVAD